MYAVIDIGSNTIRLVLYKIENNQIKSLLNKKSPAGLAGYINKDRCLKKSGIRKAVAVLSEFKEILDHMTIQEVFPFATASLRNINNAPEVLEAIRENCGFEVRILSGEEEAIFDYYGALQAMEMDKGLLTDIGGGSTELVFFSRGEIKKAASMPVGSLNMYNKYVSHLLPTKSEREKIERRVAKELNKLDLPEQVCPVLCGVGGSVRATGKLINAQEKLPPANRTVYLHTVSKVLESFRDERKENLTCLLKVTPERLHTLLPGMTILRQIARTFCSDTMIVSDYGVREGYLLSEVLQIRRLEEE